MKTKNFPKWPTLLGNFVKIFHFLVKSFWGKFYRHLVTFYCHTASGNYQCESVQELARERERVILTPKTFSERGSVCGGFTMCYSVRGSREFVC